MKLIQKYLFVPEDKMMKMSVQHRYKLITNESYSTLFKIII